MPLNDELNVMERVEEEIREGDVFYDVGAGVGEYSAMASDIISPENIYSFEPLESNFGALKVLMKLEGADEANLFNIALFDENKSVDFPEDKEPGYGKAYIGDGEGETDTMKADSLDIPPPDVVKVDVEGAELRVLNGMEEKIVEGETRCIFVECHRVAMMNRFNDLREEMEEYLDLLGYDSRLIFYHTGVRGEPVGQRRWYRFERRQ